MTDVEITLTVNNGEKDVVYTWDNDFGSLFYSVEKRIPNGTVRYIKGFFVYSEIHSFEYVGRRGGALKEFLNYKLIRWYPVNEEYTSSEGRKKAKKIIFGY